VDEPDHFTAIDLQMPCASTVSQDRQRVSELRSGEAAPSLMARVLLSGKPSWTPITTFDAAPSRNGTVLAFPVLLGRRAVGVLQFVSEDPGPPTSGQLKVLSHVGTQLGRIVERHFLQQQLVDAVWKQQREFGQELHDTLGQELTGIGMFAQALQQRLAGRNRSEADDQAELVAMIQQAKHTARELAKGLQPVEIDAFGLPAALEELTRTMRKRTGIDCVFAGAPAIPFNDDEVATHLYRIAQEAVTNAVKHAEARHISISLSADSEKFCRMEIQDDGTGIRDDAADGSGGMGMRIMKYRARSIGAELRVTNANPGTTVACELALRRP
jgi:signal transduction histidine kinase